MSLRHLKIFVAVVQQGGVTKAAQALHLAQPSVSLALRELEKYYGVALFDRLGRRLRLTECGQTFYGYAVHIISMLEEMETQIRSRYALETPRIGASVMIGTYLLPALIRQYQSGSPEMRVSVKVCRASQVEQLILDNELDIGLIETAPEHPELNALPFFRDELQAIVPPDSALAAQATVTIGELASQPFLMREPGSASRKTLDACLALHHLTVRPTWESASTQALIKAVAAGLGVAVLPQMLVARDVADGLVARIPFREPLYRTLYVIYHRRKQLSANMQRFLALCRDYAPTGEATKEDLTTP